MPGETLLEKLYLFYYNISKIPVCLECGNKVLFLSFSKGYNKYCSPTCSGKQAKKTIKNKYGVENVFQLNSVKDKIKQTNLIKYGEINPFNFGSKKYKKIIKNKYGVENVFQLNNVKDKIKQTNLIKYGVEHNSLNSETIEKRKLRRIHSFYNKLSDRTNNLVKPMFSLNEYNGIKSRYRYKWECIKCNTVFYDHLSDGHIPRCPICYPKIFIKEKEISDYCKSLGLEVRENDRSIISPYEVDIYLPDYKLAIEYNGLFWHSTKFIKDKYYHQNKVKLAQEKGIRLLHIWEHEWLEEQEQTKEKIQYYINNQSIFIETKEPELCNIHDNLIWI